MLIHDNNNNKKTNQIMLYIKNKSCTREREGLLSNASQQKGVGAQSTGLLSTPPQVKPLHTDAPLTPAQLTAFSGPDRQGQCCWGRAGSSTDAS